MEKMTFAEQKVAIEIDLEGKHQRKDRHGVSDAANDLRELEAYERGFWRAVERVRELNDGHAVKPFLPAEVVL